MNVELQTALIAKHFLHLFLFSGIYIKSDGSDCNEEDGTSQITNIV
jgi:hypothetical protein